MSIAVLTKATKIAKTAKHGVLLTYKCIRDFSVVAMQKGYEKITTSRILLIIPYNFFSKRLL